MTGAPGPAPAELEAAWADPARFLPRDRLDELIAVLRAEGRRLVGPTVGDGTIVLDEIESADELPAGYGLDQRPGSARLVEHGTPRAFDFAVPSTPWKAFTFPARVDALAVERADDGSIQVAITAPPPEPTAFLGVRACELAAMGVQDRVLARGPAADPDFVARAADRVVVAVECGVAGGTCFCTSMGTGPEVTGGHDLVLNELDDGFVVRVGSPAGDRLVAGLALPPASPGQVAAARTRTAETRATIGDPVPGDGLPARLLANLDHPRWADVAERCLSCANCTLACPTCFCTDLTVESGLDGATSTAQRSWDSCFTHGFAAVAGGNFRPRRTDRYRQWLTHKFGTWWEQFGTSGCVGCGRCVTWCPVGIDVRDELAAIAGPAPLTIAPEPGLVGIEPTSPTPAPSPTRTTAPPSLPYGFVSATVVEVRSETADTTTLRLATPGTDLPAGRPGQFVMAALPAFAMPPISISRFHPDGLELTIRAAGPATSVMARLSPGGGLALRGPLGRPWPVEQAAGGDVVIVAGGIGLAPVRPILDEILRQRDRFGEVRLYLRARTPRDRLFVDEIDSLAQRPDLTVRTTVDRAGPEWLGRVGIVTQLFDRATWDGSRATAFVCGPERMMMATADVLAGRGVASDMIWLTMERKMSCGVGLCGHCQLGPRFVCRDGPVFSVAELGEDLRMEGR